MAQEASVEKKLALVLAAQDPDVRRVDLCDAAGIHRDTLNDWERKFAAGGIEALQPRSRRPHRSPNQTPAEVEEAIVRLRKELPLDNGADVIGWHLRRQGWAKVPTDRTIHRVLARHGLVEPQPQKRPKSAWRRFEYDRPNACWQIDATGWRLTRNRPATIMDTLDDKSRAAPKLLVGDGPTTELALETLLEGGRCWGLPAMVLADNGACFKGRPDGRGGSDFESVLAAIGIRVIHSRPYHPQTCGKIERFHQTLKRWLARQPLAESLAELQAQLDAFADHYNYQRRHDALGELTAAEAHAATPHAAPAAEPIALDTTITITAAAVGKNGAINLAGRWTTSVGTEHAGRRLTVIRYGDNAVIVDGGNVLARHHLDPARPYLPSGRPPGGPRRRPY